MAFPTVKNMDVGTENEPGESDPAAGLVALSATMARVLLHARKISAFKEPVLILGETGTGKSRLAEIIHRLSSRGNKPPVKKGCGELVDEIMGSELFGHRKGAFTSAVTDRRGLLSSADGGTLILDDIDTLSLSSQSRLLRFLDDRVVTRLGDDSGGHCVDVRIIATTNCNLEARVQEGAFREDLFRRLRHWRLVVPPLRERPADVEELARRFLDAYQRKCPELCDPPLHFDAEAIDLLRSLPWPGNIRELREAVENVAAFGEPKNGCITQDTIVRTLFVAGNAPLTADRGLLSELGEDSRIHRALTLAKWDISKAARIAGCSRGTIYARIKARGWARP